MQAPEIKKIYARYARIYDAIFRRWFAPRQQHVIEALHIRPGQRVLDVGVGTGLSLPFYPRHAQVVGVDLSRAMLHEAQKKVRQQRLDHVTLLEMDAAQLAFPSDVFDVVLAAFVISVVPDPMRFLAEVKRVGKAGGQLVLINHFRSENKLLAQLETWLSPLCTKIGWRTDLALESLVREAKLPIMRTYSLHKIDLWKVVYAANTK
jgi:phosphatidylethanolamine/phosphatidyl-N-methylethanolamine N-methyltransferase